jgi:hypothetical protein
MVKMNPEPSKENDKINEIESKSTIPFRKRVLSWIVNIFLIVFAIICWGVAQVLGKSLGIFGFLIFGSCFFVYWILGKLKKEASEWYRLAIAAQTAHLLWFFLNVLYTGDFRPAAIDIFVLTFVTAWFFFRPQILPSALLLIYQVIGLIMSIYNFNLVGPDAEIYIIAHILLRSASLVGIVGNLITIGSIQEKFSRTQKRRKTASLSAKLTKDSDERHKPIEERLSKLNKIYESGLIGREEYLKKKAQLIDEL